MQIVMVNKSFIPSGELTPYVEIIYYSDGYTPPTGKERVLPSGSAQLIINLGADFFRYFKQADAPRGIESAAAIITGLNSQYIFLDPQTRLSTLSAIFKPDGIPALFNVPSIEFLDQAITLDDVINEDVIALRDQLIEAASPHAKFHLLELFLLRCLDNTHQPNAAIARAVHRINHRPGLQSISSIAGEVGYSRRRFSTLFQEAAGIAPKEYVRIQRFQQALRTIRACSEPHWAGVALSCGYYDQAHFNHDFKLLAGLTPGQYLRNQTSEKNHLPA